jgi:hypothetical protein
MLDFKDIRTAAPRRAPRRPHDSPTVHQSAGRTRNLDAPRRHRALDFDATTRGIASPAGSLLGDAHLKQKTFKKNSFWFLFRRYVFANPGWLEITDSDEPEQATMCTQTPATQAAWDAMFEPEPEPKPAPEPEQAADVQPVKKKRRRLNGLNAVRIAYVLAPSLVFPTV